MIRRFALATALLLTLAGAAWAQGTIEPAPTPDQQTPADSAINAVPVPDDQTPSPPKPAPTQAPPAVSWVPRGTALVQVLDKVDAQSTTLEVPVGGQQTYRSVTIAVKACAARPPDQPPDATAYLSVMPNGGEVPSFIGWMLQAEPAASLLQDPVYDVRLLGCR